MLERIVRKSGKSMQEWTEAAKDNKQMNKEALNNYGLPEISESENQ